MRVEMLGDIELRCQDCMEYMRGLEDNAFDLAIVDPPYRNASENQPTKDMRRNGGEMMQKWNDKPSKEFFDELFRVSKHQIIFGANNFELPTYKGFFVWKKKTIGEDFTMSMCELAYVSEGLSTIAKMYECAPQRDKDNAFHPTSKPIQLYRWLLHKYAKGGWKILDTHIGSGSSAIACYMEGHELVGCEINEEYFDKMVVRVRNSMTQGSLF